MLLQLRGFGKPSLGIYLFYQDSNLLRLIILMRVILQTQLELIKIASRTMHERKFRVSHNEICNKIAHYSKHMQPWNYPLSITWYQLVRQHPVALGLARSLHSLPL